MSVVTYAAECYRMLALLASTSGTATVGFWWRRSLSRCRSELFGSSRCGKRALLSVLGRTCIRTVSMRFTVRVDVVQLSYSPMCVVTVCYVGLCVFLAVFLRPCHCLIFCIEENRSFGWPPV